MKKEASAIPILRRKIAFPVETLAETLQRKDRENSQIIQYNIEKLARLDGISPQEAVDKYSNDIENVLIRQRKKKYSTEYVQCKVDLYVESMMAKTLEKREKLREKR